MAYAAGVDATLQEKYSREAQIEYMQMESPVWNLISHKNFQGKTYNVPLVKDDTDAVSGFTRHAMLTIADEETDNVAIDTGVIYKRFLIHDWEQFQRDLDYRTSLYRLAGAKVWQGVDAAIFAAVNTTNGGEVTMPSAGVFDYAGADAILTGFENNDVPTGNLKGAISPKAMSGIRVDTTYINNFHNDNSVVTGHKPRNVAGIDVVTSTLLPNGAAGATERRSFFWDKESVLGVITQPFRTLVHYEELYMGYMITASIQFGAGVTRGNGVLFADITQ